MCYDSGLERQALVLRALGVIDEHPDLLSVGVHTTRDCPKTGQLYPRVGYTIQQLYSMAERLGTCGSSFTERGHHRCGDAFITVIIDSVNIHSVTLISG